MKARRTDDNHKIIAQAFWKLGCLVHNTIGDWDLVVCIPAQPKSIRLIEIKNPKQPPSKRKLTKNEMSLLIEGWPILRVETVEDVETIVKGMR